MSVTSPTFGYQIGGSEKRADGCRRVALEDVVLASIRSHTRFGRVLRPEVEKWWMTTGLEEIGICHDMSSISARLAMEIHSVEMIYIYVCMYIYICVYIYII